jgi:uncharacterized phage protein (TIGR02218 family)
VTFSTIENSREDGNILELYEFRFGVETTRLTSYNRNIVFQGVTWTATQISRSEVQNSTEQAINEIKIDLPLTNSIAAKYILNVPGRVGSIQIFRAHADDPSEETVLLFDGFISQASFDGALVATLSCSPSTSVFKRSGPRFNYQSLCNHILYDVRCKILEAAFQFTGTVIVESGRTIEVAGLFAAEGADWAVSGFVRSPAGSFDDARLVIAQSGDVLTLLNNFAIPAIGGSVDVFAGCDHSLAICESKFANVINYGGFPFVPIKNPFNSSLRGGK